MLEIKVLERKEENIMDNKELLGMITSGQIDEKEFFGHKLNDLSTKNNCHIVGEVTEEEYNMILNAYGVKKENNNGNSK